MREGVPGIENAAAIDAYFAAHVAGAVPPLEFDVIAGGHSNITYRATDAAGTAFVLRRPPLGHVLATAHDMAREHRLISAVGRSTVPVAPALACCTDTSVNGAPFYVMAFVEGAVVAKADEVDAVLPNVAQRQALGLHAADVLADLHRVDVDEVGLGDLARREGYLDRQLKRWRTQWEASKTRELPAMEEAYELLLARKPEQRYTGIVHGDYRIGNMIAVVDSPDAAHIGAVLDWELCTLGDVLADVGYYLNYCIEADEVAGSGVVDPPPQAAGGFPSREAFVERYAARTGFDCGAIEYYRAFQYWRSAAIAEGVKRRYIEGVMVDASFPVELYDERVAQLAQLSVDRVRTLAGS